MNVHGKVVWHDLMTTDVAKSKAFYSELFGWRVVEHDEWAFLTHADSNDHFGTLLTIPKPGVPSHWAPYIAVDDLDAVLKAIPAAGGKLHMGKMPAGETGHFAYAADPQGGTFVPWQYAAGGAKPESDDPPPPGHFCWDELHTPDPQAAEAFYTQVIGWTTQHMEMPGMRYTVLLRHAQRADGSPRQGAGLLQAQPGIPWAFWLSYVAVADCDATVERVGKLGGQVVAGAMDIPNVGRMAVFSDSTGASFAVLGPNKK